MSEGVLEALGQGIWQGLPCLFGVVVVGLLARIAFSTKKKGKGE